MKKILLILSTFYIPQLSPAAATVTEIYRRPLAVKGAPIRAPMRMLPPMPSRPTPPTPAERAALAAHWQARRDYAAARDAYLVKLGFTAATTNTVRLRADTVRLQFAAQKIVVAEKAITIQKETKK